MSVKLATITASLENIDKNFHGLYVKDEAKGIYVLQLTGVDEHPEVKGLKDNKETILTEKKTLEAQVKAWEKVGKTPEEITQLVAGAEEAKRAKLIAEGKIDEVLAAERTKHQSTVEQLTTNHRTELESRTKREQELLGSLNQSLRVNAIDTALSQLKGKPTLLKDKLLNETELVEVKEGDKTSFVVRVKDGKGGHLMADSVGNYMSPLQYLETLKKDVDNYGGAFEAASAGGGGAASNQTKTGTAGGGAATGTEGQTGVSKIAAGLEARKAS